MASSSHLPAVICSCPAPIKDRFMHKPCELPCRSSSRGLILKSPCESAIAWGGLAPPWGCRGPESKLLQGLDRAKTERDHHCQSSGLLLTPHPIPAKAQLFALTEAIPPDSKPGKHFRTSTPPEPLEHFYSPWPNGASSQAIWHAATACPRQPCQPR